MGSEPCLLSRHLFAGNRWVSQDPAGESGGHCHSCHPRVMDPIFHSSWSFLFICSDLFFSSLLTPGGDISGLPPLISPCSLLGALAGGRGSLHLSHEPCLSRSCWAPRTSCSAGLCRLDSRVPIVTWPLPWPHLHSPQSPGGASAPVGTDWLSVCTCATS
jgi:hypothetical protein